MTNNILVLGGTGKTGRKVAQLLSQKNQTIRIGSRSARPAFDWRDSSTWKPALEGMNKVYVTFQPDLAVPGALQIIQNFTQEALAAGIEKLVLLSGRGEKEAQACEQVVIQSGIGHCIVRSSWFNQNFSESFLLEPILAGMVALPKSKVLVPFVDTDDIAEVVVAALLDDAHDGKLYELTGPKLLTFQDAIQEIAKATGREIQFVPIPLATYTKELENTGLPSDYVWLINYLFAEVLGNEENSTISHDIEKVLRRKAKNFQQYVQELAPSGIWNPTSKEAIF